MGLGDEPLVFLHCVLERLVDLFKDLRAFSEAGGADGEQSPLSEDSGFITLLPLSRKIV